jgi:hypothetical protein
MPKPSRPVMVVEFVCCIPLLALLAEQAKPVTVLQYISHATDVVNVTVPAPIVLPKLNIASTGSVTGCENVNVLVPVHQPGLWLELAGLSAQVKFA